MFTIMSVLPSVIVLLISNLEMVLNIVKTVGHMVMMTTWQVIFIEYNGRVRIGQLLTLADDQTNNCHLVLTSQTFSLFS